MLFSIRILLTVALVVLCAGPGFAADPLIPSYDEYLEKLKKDSEERQARWAFQIEKCVQTVKKELP